MCASFIGSLLSSLPFGTPGRSLNIRRAGGLTPEQIEVEDQAHALVRRRFTHLKRQYIKRFGIIVGTDLARELFPAYAASNESRTLYGSAVQAAAAAIADGVFEDLTKKRTLAASDVVFMAGGTGAGKTTAVRDAFGYHIQDAKMVYDSNLNSLASAKTKIDMVLRAGSSAVILYVHRDPVESFIDGVLPRALREGRVVSVSAHARIHSECIKTIKKLTKDYADKKLWVSFYVLHNVMGEKPRLKPVEFLDSIKYSRDALRAEITAILDSNYVGQVPEPLYSAIRV